MDLYPPSVANANTVVVGGMFGFCQYSRRGRTEFLVLLESCGRGGLKYCTFMFVVFLLVLLSAVKVVLTNKVEFYGIANKTW